MKDILPPYGVILRDAIRSGDRELMRAYLDYSKFVMSQYPDIAGDQAADWKAAHAELEKAAS